VANYPEGTQKVLFDPTPPHLAQPEVQQLLQWLDERMEMRDIHPLVMTAGFVYEFLSIHPYKDGNGRLSRLLTTLLLMKQDYQFIQYVSFENVIENRKEEYYRVLMDGQKDRYKDSERINARRRCLISSKRMSHHKLEILRKLWKSIPEILSRKILITLSKKVYY
jgi:Fic family protein